MWHNWERREMLKEYRLETLKERGLFDDVGIDKSRIIK
jgi:hypothetical protein